MRPLSGTGHSWQAEFGDAFAGRRVLVTGATGFIGWHLCEALTALGAKVHGLSRSAQKRGLPRDCRPWAVDLTELEGVRAVASKVQPQFLYHLAGVVTASQDLDLVLPTLYNNLVGTVHLLLAALKADCDRVVVVGSAEEPPACATDEAPTSPYAAAKASASVYARLFHRVYGLPVVVVRPFLTYGPRQGTEKLIPYTVLALLRGESPHLSSGERRCDFVYVLDVVRGLLKAGEQPGLEGATLDLGTGQGIYVRDAVELLVELSGSAALPVFSTVSERVGERSLVADRGAIRRRLDWEPLWSLRNGLAETVAWYRASMEDADGRG